MLKRGSVVRSIAGHDKDRFYMIVALEGARAWIADGKQRKLEKPKAKNVLHVRKTNSVFNPDAVCTNKKLREALRDFSAGEKGGY